MHGWSTAFREDFVSDATPAILIGFMLFLWPSKLPNFGDAESFGKRLKYEAILNWKIVSKKFPWDVVLLLGGALALADGVEVTIMRRPFLPNCDTELFKI